jgi:hypothetical protein
MDFLGEVTVLENLEHIVRDLLQRAIHILTLVRRNLRTRYQLSPTRIVRDQARLQTRGKLLNPNYRSLIEYLVSPTLALSLIVEAFLLRHGILIALLKLGEPSILDAL